MRELGSRPACCQHTEYMEWSMIKSQRYQWHMHRVMVGVTSKRILQMTLRKSVFPNRLKTFETIPKVSRSVKRFGNGEHFAPASSVAHFVLQHPVLSHFLSAACEHNDSVLLVTSPPCHTMTVYPVKASTKCGFISGCHYAAHAHVCVGMLCGA